MLDNCTEAVNCLRLFQTFGKEVYCGFAPVFSNKLNECGVLQTSDKGANGSAEPRQVAAVQHTAAAHPGAEYSATSHTLLAHLTRLRQPRHRRSPHSHPGNYKTDLRPNN